MELKNIKVALAYESATNPRGSEFEGPAFDDLVASVKEKGVLVPVIARPKQKGKLEFEIVAGNRRFRAAKQIGLKEIPARIEEMTDDQAGEVQIIENLQREDIHPLEEGAAYRKLVEKSKYTVKDLAVQVGKSEEYVRFRLFITNLIPEVAAAYRKGSILTGHALIIGKLSPDDQKRALGESISWTGMPAPVKDLQDWVDDEINKSIKNQPWLGDAEANKYIGPCTKCPPNVPTLFGERKDGECTDKGCWDIKMKKYIQFKSEKQGMLKVSFYWGRRRGTLFNGQFRKITSKDKCEGSRQAVIVDDKDRGKIIWVCVDSACKKHKEKIELPKWFLGEDKTVRMTKEEKEAQEKKQKEKDDKRNEKFKMERIKETTLEGQEIKNLAIKFDLNPKNLKEKMDIIAVMTVNAVSEYCWEEILRGHGWYPENMDEDNFDDEKCLIEKIKELKSETDKFRVIIEILIHNNREEMRKIIKKL